MPMPTPAQAANNWSSGMANSSEKMKAGIQAVTTAPTHLAAAAVDRMVAGIQRAAASGKIRDRLMSVNLADWQAAMINKGIPRISAGTSQAKPKVQAFFQNFLPFLKAGVDQLNATMPRGDTEQNIQRAVSMMRYNSTYKNRG